MIVQAYVDDSTSNTGNHRFVLAAYVENAENWVLFSDAWDDVLHQHPRVEYLKMSEAVSSRGAFRDLSAAEGVAKVFALGCLIDELSPRSLQCSVSGDAYKRVIVPRMPYLLQNPYFVCFYSVIFGVARFMDKLNPNCSVDLIFDEQESLGTDTLIFYQDMRRLLSDNLAKYVSSSPVVRDDKKVMPLQAADMLAWALRREIEGTPTPDYNGLLPLIRKSGRHYIYDMDENLEMLAEGFVGFDTAQSRTKSAWYKARRHIVLQKGEQDHSAGLFGAAVSNRSIASTASVGLSPPAGRSSRADSPNRRLCSACVIGRSVFSA